MNGFSGVTYSEINDIASGLNSSSASMQDLLSRVEAQLKKIGSDNGTWSGTAASAAFEEFEVLINKFPEFSQAIKDCSSYLQRVVSNYQSVDNAVRG